MEFVNRLLLSIVIVIFSYTTNAKELVAFSGVTFQGGANEISALYPYSSALVKSEKVSPFIFKTLYKNQPANFQISPQILDKSEGHRYAFALMVDGEYISVEQIAIGRKKRFKVIAFLSAQVVMFDVVRSQFLASIPLKPVQFTEVFKEEPSEADKKQLIKKVMLVEESNFSGLVPRFLEKIKTAEAPGKANLTQIAVRNVEVQDKAFHALPSHLKEANGAALSKFIAQQVAKNLSIYHSVATQPFVVDSSVLTMQSRFTGGETTYNLKLPKPAYVVDYTLRGFKRVVEVEKSKVAKIFAYFSFANLSVYQNAGEQKQLFMQNVKNFARKKVPDSQTLVDDWAAYRESLLALLEKSTNDIFEPKSQFFKFQKFPKSIYKQLENLKEVYEQCHI